MLSRGKVGPGWVAAMIGALLLGLMGSLPASAADPSSDPADPLAASLLEEADLPTGFVSDGGIVEGSNFDIAADTFSANGGLRVLSQSWQSPTSGAIFDFRMAFPTAADAAAYLVSAQAVLSEEAATGLTLSEDADPIGEDGRHWVGEAKVGEITVAFDNYLFHVGPVAAKVFVGGVDLAAGITDAIATRAAEKMVGATEAQPSQRPIGVDTDVPYVDPEGAQAGLVTIREIEDPFTEFREDSPPGDDQRYVQLTVAFEAADDKPFEAHPSYIVLQDTDGFLWGYTTINRPPDATPKELESQGLEAGDRVSGVISYVIPKSGPTSPGSTSTSSSTTTAPTSIRTW